MDSSGKPSGDNREMSGLTTQPLPDGWKLSATARIAYWSARHRWWVLASSVVVIVLGVFVIFSLGTETRSDDEGVGESGRAVELMDERFRREPNPGEHRVPTRTERLIFSNPSLDVDDPAFRSIVQGTVDDIRAVPGVSAVGSYYDTSDPDMLSEDGHAVLGFVSLQGPSIRHGLEEVLGVVNSAEQEAVGFEIGVVSFSLIEDEIDEIIDDDFSRIMFISLGLGLVILLLAFRAVVAAVIPLAMAVGAIFSAIGVATLVSRAYPLVDFYAEMILLMGLAVGIDYSLFIVSRFRDERRAGRPKLEAIGVASNTTGRAVFYAGITVILSLTGLMLTGSPTFISLALGAIIVVFIAVVGSLTLLPALLSALGDNVNRLKIPFLGRENSQAGFWGAITDRVLARPAVLSTLTAGALITLAIPVFFLNLGFNEGSDALPDAVEGKRAVELLEEYFSSSLIRPARVVVDAPDVRTPEVEAAVARFTQRLEQDDAYLGPFDIRVSPAGNLLRINVPVAGKIDDEESEEALKRLREEIIPQAFSGTGAKVYVAGATADSVDFRTEMYAKAPYVFGFVMGLSFLLLLVMFRSIVIPLKAILLNLLSVGAAYGVLVMVFQWGWGIGILGSEASGVIESWLPLFLFGILFGLSMDYHMLLLNRIKEVYDQGRGNEEAVSMGIKLTAGQITSAAAIMVGVFGTFATSRALGLQQFGVGLAVAVLIDATVIRVVLLPASMKLLGKWNWYLPAWLDWLPNVTPDLAPPLARPFPMRSRQREQTNEDIKMISSGRRRVMSTSKAVVAGIRRSVGAAAVDRRPDASPLLSVDRWHLTNAAARGLGKFWSRTLLRR